MKDKLPLPPEDAVDLPHIPDDGMHEIAPDIAYKRLAIVNVVFIGTRDCGNHEWVLVDTGPPGFTSMLIQAAADRFGPGSLPSCIVMTHGHFDHAGGLEKLVEKWKVPVYAHSLELPYLNGSAAYPPVDPMVGGGIVPLLAPLFPGGPIDVTGRLRELPVDGAIPGMPGWRWLPTPGHSPGHISLWRESGRILIAGDAFITTSMDSAYCVAMQKPELHGPPTFLTPDWKAARESVESLASLEPELVIAGHGRAMGGAEIRRALHLLALEFERFAVPSGGRYVMAPARAEDGTAYRIP